MPSTTKIISWPVSECASDRWRSPGPSDQSHNSVSFVDGAVPSNIALLPATFPCHARLFTRLPSAASSEIGRAHVELQSLMRISYAVFCLKKKRQHTYTLP